MKKIFKFEERIPATVVQCYEVIAETEEQALAMVQDGEGFTRAYTSTNGYGEFELFDTAELPKQGLGLDNLNRRLS